MAFCPSPSPTGRLVKARRGSERSDRRHVSPLVAAGHRWRQGIPPLDSDVSRLDGWTCLSASLPKS